MDEPVPRREFREGQGCVRSREVEDPVRLGAGGFGVVRDVDAGPARPGDQPCILAERDQTGALDGADQPAAGIVDDGTGYGIRPIRPAAPTTTSRISAITASAIARSCQPGCGPSYPSMMMRSISAPPFCLARAS